MYFNFLDKWNKNNTYIRDDGVLFMTKIDNYYLHILQPSLTVDENEFIQELKKIGKKTGDGLNEYYKFLNEYNGGSLYCSAIILFGFTYVNFVRNANAPASLVRNNSFDQNFKNKEDILWIGRISYTEDSNMNLYLDIDSGEIFGFVGKEIIHEWRNLKEMIANIVTIYDSVYSENGISIFDNNPKSDFDNSVTYKKASDIYYGRNNTNYN